MKTSIAMFAVCVATGLAAADSVDATFTGVAGGHHATQLRVGHGTYYAGHMNHTILSGDRAGETFATFCIDFAETAHRDRNTSYEIVDIADAPMPGTPYGQEIADRINAVVANAEALGWIDDQLQADTNQHNYLAKMGAIQAAIWEAFGSPVNIDSRRTSNSLEHYYNVLTDDNTFDSSLRLNGLRAMVSEGQQGARDERHHH